MGNRHEQKPFSYDGGETTYPGYEFGGVGAGGFFIPYFDEETTLRILSDLVGGDASKFGYDGEHDRFWNRCDGAETEYHYAERKRIGRGQFAILYPVGDGGWTWNPENGEEG